MKRVSRKMSQEQKNKISKALKGIKRSAQTKEKQSRAMRNYWASVPNSDEENKEDTNNMDDEKESKAK